MKIYYDWDDGPIFLEEECDYEPGTYKIDVNPDTGFTIIFDPNIMDNKKAIRILVAQAVIPAIDEMVRNLKDERAKLKKALKQVRK